MLKHRLALATGIPGFYSWLVRNRPLIITYHGLYEGPKRQGEYPPTFVHVRDFEEQIAYLTRNYHILTPDEFARSIAGGLPFARNAALVTFDDGYESFGRLAANVLEKHSVRAVVFLATKYVEDGAPFWFDLVWALMRAGEGSTPRHPVSEAGALVEDERPTTGSTLPALKSLSHKERELAIASLMRRFGERASKVGATRSFTALPVEAIRRLSDAGVEFGGHTHSHTIMSVMSVDECRHEVETNKAAIEGITGRPCRFFAYPNGGAGDFTAAHGGLLSKAGYLAAFSLTQRRTDPHRSPFAISRFHISPEDDLTSLQLRFSGAMVCARVLLNFAHPVSAI